MIYEFRPATVAHPCNLCCTGDRDRYIMVWGQSKQKVGKTLSQKEAGLVVYPCNSSDSEGQGRRIAVLSHPRKKYETLYEKQTKRKETEGIIPVVVRLWVQSTVPQKNFYKTKICVLNSFVLIKMVMTVH
jgi:hypothetical protein